MKLVILGMHRSGTSLVSGVLSKNDVFVGDNLIDTNEENPKGFFERKDFRKINDAFLLENDSDWYNIEEFVKGKVTATSLASYKEHFVNIIESYFEGKEKWLCKEPRFCLTYKYFKDWIGSHQVLFVYRDPLDVAYSLYKRNQFPIEYGLALWEVYNKVALESIDRANTLIVGYHQFLGRDVGMLNKLAEFTGLNLEEIDLSFLDSKLQRSNVRQEPIEGYLTESQKKLFSELEEDVEEFDLSLSKGVLFSLNQHQNCNSILMKQKQQEINSFKSDFEGKWGRLLKYFKFISR